MADLRTILGDLGYTDVKTHLQSGNAVLTTSAKAAKVERDIEAAIRKEHGLEVPCLVRTAPNSARSSTPIRSATGHRPLALLRGVPLGAAGRDAHR